jgi:uncharacterized protein (DUF1499 family)
MISLKIIPVAIVLIIIIYLASLSYMTRQHRIKPDDEHQLKPCPNKPNCVLSLSEKESQAIEAFQISWENLKTAITKSGGEILIDDGQYCHAVFTSTIFRFKDDFEAVQNNNQINIRSASRAGKSDLGQNRKRVEKIRLLYNN